MLDPDGWKAAVTHPARGLAARFAAILLIVAVCPVAAAGAPAINAVDKGLPGEVPVSLDMDGRATLHVTLPDGNATTGGTLVLGEFRTATGRAVDVLFVTATTKPRTLALPKGNLNHVVAVEVGSLGRGETARGELVLASPPGTEVLRKILALTRAGKPVWQGLDDDQNVREISVGADGLASLRFDPRPLPSGHAGELTVTLSEFFDKSGGEKAAVRLLDAKADGSLRLDPATTWPLEVRFDASGVRSGQIHYGTLEVRAGGAVLRSESLKLTRSPQPREATVVISPSSIEQRVEWCWALACRPAPFDVQISEPSGAYPLRGIVLRPKREQTKEASVDGTLRVTAELVPPVALSSTSHPGGASCPASSGLLSRDPRDDAAMKARSIPVGGVATVRVCLSPLPPGEHKVVLVVDALNVADGKAAELTMVAKIRWAPLYPFLVLVFAVLFSYAATKGVRTLRRRAELAQRVQTLRDSYWLKRDETSAIPIVLAKASLASVAKAIQQEGGLVAWAAVPATLESKVVEIEKRLPLLERISALDAEWTRSSEDRMVRRRAQKLLRSIVQELAVLPLGAEPPKALESRLTSLEGWSRHEDVLTLYWSSLRYDMQQVETKMKARLVTGELSGGLDADETRALSDGLAQAAAAPGVLGEAAQALKSLLTAVANTRQGARGDLADLARALAESSTAGSDLSSVVKAASAAIDQQSKGDLAPVATALGPLGERLQRPQLADLDERLRVIAERLAAMGQLPDAASESQREACVTAVQRVSEKWKGFVDCAPLLEKLAASDAEMARSLLARLRSGEPPANLEDAIARDQIYATLKILAERYELVERHGEKEKGRLSELFEAHRAKKHLVELLEMVDRWAWADLQEGELTFKKPDPVAKRPFVAYDLIDFEVAPKSGHAGESFLFKHGLQWTWAISFTDGRSGVVEDPLHVTTREPRVTQFIPVQTDKVSAEVRVTWLEGKPFACTLPFPCTLEEGIVKIQPPTEFGVTGAFGRAESIAVIMAALVAVVTGMQSTFYDKALFGSLENFLGLFGWGVAAEQTKNFLENIRTYTGSAETK